MIRRIVYHAPENATGALVICPCCGESLLLDMRLLASPHSCTPAAPDTSPPAHTGAEEAADTFAPCPTAQASGQVNDCCDCHWWERVCTYSVIGTCKHPKIGGMQTVAKSGGCTSHYLPRWNDGTDD